MRAVPASKMTSDVLFDSGPKFPSWKLKGTSLVLSETSWGATGTEYYEQLIVDIHQRTWHVVWDPAEPYWINWDMDNQGVSGNDPIDEFLELLLDKDAFML